MVALHKQRLPSQVVRFMVVQMRSFIDPPAGTASAKMAGASRAGIPTEW